MKAVVKFGGERIDRIARALLGTEQDGAVTALLNANPGLAAKVVNGVVPEGTEIDPPADFSPPASADILLAWE